MTWDEYYHNICIAVGQRTRCMSRKIGAILVRDKSVISTGYNGPPRGVPHCNERYIIDNELRKALQKKKLDPDNPEYHDICPRQVLEFKSGEGLEYCIASHAEANTIINAAFTGVETKGTTMYMTCGIPCKDCLKTIINAGIKEIVVTKLEYYDLLSSFLLINSSLEARVFDFIEGRTDGNK